MPRATFAAILLGCLTLTVGCSGSKPYVAPTGSAVFNAETNAESVDNNAAPLGGLSALEVWEKTKADADSAKSVRVTAKFLDGNAKISIDLKMTDAGQAFGTLVFDGEEVKVRRLDKTLYFKAARGFWVTYGDTASADQLANKWIKVKQGFSANLEQFFQFTDMDFIVADTMSLSSGEQKGLKRVAGDDIDDKPTVGLANESTEGTDSVQTLYVSATDPALPMQFAMNSDKSQYMKFRSWNQDVKVVAPKGAIDLAKAS